VTYSTSHYERNKEYYDRRDRAKREHKRNLVNSYLNQPCTDCGVQYPWWVMQFDHLRDKEFGISVGVVNGYSDERLVAEIAKCEVVCANCHSDRTHQRRASTTGSAQSW
jgi:hypothetical protein